MIELLLTDRLCLRVICQDQTWEYFNFPSSVCQMIPIQRSLYPFLADCALTIIKTYIVCVKGTTSRSAWRSGRARTRGSPASTTSCWPCSPHSSASPWRAGPLSSTGCVLSSFSGPRCRCHCPDCLAETRLAATGSPSRPTHHHFSLKL